MSRHPVLAALLALAGPTVSHAAGPTATELVARQLIRGARTLVEVQPLTIQELEVSLDMVQTAVGLVPDNAEAWRTLLKLADLAEREDVRREALERLVRLDPDDQVVRLRRISEAIDRFQTLEERQSAYERLLGDAANRQALGPAVASRLAHDYAVLLDRSGDVAGFARWLAEAVSLDPSNRVAAATAAGFFRMNASDPFAEAELFTTLVMADPNSVEAQTVLADLLLHHGAYRGADRIYSLAASVVRAQGLNPAPGMLADRAVAQWGHGDAEGALETIQSRQREVDELYRLAARRQNPGLTPLEAARLQSPIAATLATVRAAIHNSRGDELAADTLRSALASYDEVIKSMGQQEEVTPADIATRQLEAAFVGLWLGTDVERATRAIDAATELASDGLSPQARSRFDGWIALRNGDLAAAEALLQPLADADPAARLGLGLALEAQGRRADAARCFYDVAQADPGSLMAVWCAHRLASMLGRPVPVADEAKRLEALIAAIPQVLDRMIGEPTLAASLRLSPTKAAYDCFEPITLELEITNNAPFPLAIDPRGPIKPQVAILVSVQVSREPALDELRPMIVDIDRRLRLEPRERLVIPIDLRAGSMAQVLNRAPMRGATLRVRAMMGFQLPRGTVLVPGMLGSETLAPPIRIDGIRLTPQWIAEAMAGVVEPDSIQDLRDAALLCHLIAVVHRTREEAPLEAIKRFGNPRQIAEEAAVAVTECFSKMDPISRSWLLGAIPRSAPLDPLYTLAQQDPDHLVRLSYLLYCMTGADDPMIDAAIRGDDPVLRETAKMMKARIAAATGQ